MTHKDIYTKFMIEYDKAGASTSYPSLTEYEVATVLDKAYNALIAQKVTGNNYRRATFESDIKSIADLGPLTKSKSLFVSPLGEGGFAQNVVKTEAPKDMLYFLLASMKYLNNSEYTAFDNKKPNTDERLYDPLDGISTRSTLVKLVNHDIAQKFFASSSNIPWVKQPVCFLEDRDIYVVYDPLNAPVTSDLEYFQLSKTDKDNTAETIIRKYNVNPSVISALNNLFSPSQTSIKIWDNTLQGILESIDGGVLALLNNKIFTFALSEYAEGVLLRDEIIGSGSELQEVTTPTTEYTEEEASTLTDPTVWFTIITPDSPSFRVTYIRRPNTFVKDLPTVSNGWVSYFDYNLNQPVEDLSGSEESENEEVESLSEPHTLVDDSTEIFETVDGISISFKDRYTFECNSTVAEELVSLAVTFALENVESQRLNSKLNMRGLEA